MADVLLTSKGYVGPVGPLSDRPVVSTVMVSDGRAYDEIKIWTRGIRSGSILVNKGDGIIVAKRLFGPDLYTTDILQPDHSSKL